VTSNVPEFVVRRQPPDDVHEIIDGLMQPIPRPSKAHESICEALENALREHLACSLEQVFTARDRRPLCTDRSTLYPDFWVSTLCRDPVNEQRVAYPGLVIEVLSPFREKVDRGAKLHAYREIDSVQELLVIDPARGRSELYRRCGPRQWQFTDVDRSEPIHLDSIGMSLEGLPGFGYR
jgi:Uma2 family endonuclease